MACLSIADTLHTLVSGAKVELNLSVEELIGLALAHGEASQAANGAIVAYTGDRTGRSPKDKFTVEDEITRSSVDWGRVNLPFSPTRFDSLFERVIEHLSTRSLFVQDLYCGADVAYRLPLRIISEYAWHALFVRQLFIRLLIPLE